MSVLCLLYRHLKKNKSLLSQKYVCFNCPKQSNFQILLLQSNKARLFCHHCLSRHPFVSPQRSKTLCFCRRSLAGLADFLTIACKNSHILSLQSSRFRPLAFYQNPTNVSVTERRDIPFCGVPMLPVSPYIFHSPNISLITLEWNVLLTLQKANTGTNFRNECKIS